MPAARAVSIALRTAHLTTFGLLLGGHAFGVEAGRLVPALWLTVASGLGLVAVEVYAAGPYWFVLGKGVMALAKLAVLAAVPFFWEQRLALLLLVIVIASVGSHMPARYRHYSLLHRRVIERGEPLRRRSRSGQPAAVAAALGGPVKAR